MAISYDYMYIYTQLIIIYSVQLYINVGLWFMVGSLT